MKNNNYINIKKLSFLTLCAALTCTSFSTANITDAAAKTAKPAVKSLSMFVGNSKKIKIKNKKKTAVYSYTSSKKKVAAVSKKGLVKALKKGTATITVREKYKKKTKKIGSVKVVVRNMLKDNTITDNKLTPPSDNTANEPAINANVTNAPVTTPAATAAPVQTAPPTAAPTRTPLVLTDTDTPSDFDVKKSGIEYGTIMKIKYHSDTVGTDRNANIILPPDFDQASDTKYPVLYLFHGGNGDEDDWLDGNPAAILGNLVDEGLTDQMIVVMPNCRARANDKKDPSDSLSHEHMDAWTNFLNDFKNDLMPYINENYPVYTDREHTAIAGLSMGGRTALYLGFSLPDKVSYIGAFSPAYGIFEYENWGLHEDGYFTEDEFKFPEEYMDNTTCMIMNGDSDSMVKKEPERYHNALVENNVNHYYYTLPGADHNMVAWKNGLYNFLKIVFK